MGTDIANNDSNGKVTMAIIATKLDAILEELKEKSRCDEAQNSRLNILEQGQVRRETQIGSITQSLKDVTEQVEGLKSRDWWTSGISGALAFIANLVVT